MRRKYHRRTWVVFSIGRSGVHIRTFHTRVGVTGYCNTLRNHGNFVVSWQTK